MQTGVVLGMEPNERRKTVMLRPFVLVLAVLFAASAGVRAETGGNIGPRESEGSTPESHLKRMLEVNDKTVGMMLSGGKRVDLYAVETMVQCFEGAVHMASFDNQWEGQPRSRIARSIFGEERYDSLEKKCLAALKSRDEDARIAARCFLARGLASRVCEEAWTREVREAMEEYKRTGDFGISRDECISLAENLAWLGNAAGKEVLLGVLRADKRPGMMTKRTILAMKAAGEPIPDGILEKLLLSADEIVACTAFESIHGDWKRPPALGAAQAQLERLARNHGRHGTLPAGELRLLMDAGSLLLAASRAGALPDGTKSAAKTAIRHFVECGDTVLAERAARLFGELAGEEDEGVLLSMMATDSTILRSSGTVGLCRCPVEVLERNLARLRELQEDPDWTVRFQAANGLQKLCDAGKIPPGSFTPSVSFWVSR